MGPVPGGRVETGAKGIQLVVVTTQGGRGRDADGGSGGRTDGLGVSIHMGLRRRQNKLVGE